MKRAWDWARRGVAWFRVRPDRWMVLLLTLFALAKGVAWVSLFPLWKIADEPAHFDAVQFRGEHDWKAPPNEGRRLDPVMNAGASVELHKSWLTAQMYFRDTYHKFLSTVPEEGILAKMAKEQKYRETDGQMPEVGYPGFYYTLSAAPYRMMREKSIINRAYAVRLVSALFGLLAVLATFLAARWAFLAPEPAFAAALIVDLQPMFSQQTSAVNNDAAVFGLCALAFLIQLRILNTQKTALRDGALLGVTVALAIESKGAGWVMLGTSLLLLAWLAKTSWPSAWRVAAAAIVGYSIIMILGALWPQAHPRNVNPAAAVPPRPGSFPYSVTAIAGDAFALLSWIGALDPTFRESLFRSTWGQFSWMEFALTSTWLDVIWGAWPLVVFGLAGALALWMTRPDLLWWRGKSVAFAALTAFAATLAIFYVEFHERGGKVHIIQGRNFLFAAPAYAILLVLGLGSLVPKRLRGLTMAMAVTAALCLNAGAFLCVMRQHYGG